jgi:S-adenosylmethionine:tRNA ribosyltransferase-isomerase
MKYSLSDFDFDLPDALIAQMPLPDRTASRLLHVDGEQLVDRHFSDVIDQLAAGDLLVFNDTRVLKARFLVSRKPAAKCNCWLSACYRIRMTTAACWCRCAHQNHRCREVKSGWQMRSMWWWVNVRANFSLFFPDDIFTLLETYGRLPLPPYIEHDADDFDEQRYQTV